MGAVQRRCPAGHRQQVATVQNASAHLPAGVELRDQPAALGAPDVGGPVERGGRTGSGPGGHNGVVLRHAAQSASLGDVEYTHLGRSGLSVSRLCLGTMNFGWQTSEEDSHEIMDRALAEGVNFFDTANVYGFSEGKGRTEEVIGTWFALGGERRHKTVLATKVYGGMSDWPNDTYLSARNIVRACEESLRRLQTDWIDLYQFHHVDLRSPWDEIWQACQTLVAQGKVLYVGSSNHAGWQIAAANEAAARRHFQGLVSEQSIYNLVTRHVELEVLPAAEHYGVGIIPWSPLHGGLLAGALEKSQEGSRRYEGRAKQDLDEHRAALEEYESFCRELGRAPADVGLAWLLHQPAVTAPIVGPRTMEQFEGSLAALDVELDDAALDRLDEIFPGFKAAPMEYAW